MIKAIIGAVSGVAQGVVEARAAKSAAKAKLAEAKLTAEIRMIEKRADSETDWDLEALRQTQYSYKDEIALAVILAPFIGSFLPWTQDHVAQGWRHLNEHAPSWYTAIFCASIAASMGIRWAVSQFGGKK
jgi:hypothetical protein